MAFSACSNDTTDKSTVDGVSDEVYEQLVQLYFFTTTMTDIITDEIEMEDKSDNSWIVEHELFEEAEEYAEENDDVTSPRDVFPNPLMFEYMTESKSFNDTEQSYIETMEEFVEASSRLNHDAYEPLKKQLKEDLKIKDSYNMFGVS